MKLSNLRNCLSAVPSAGTSLRDEPHLVKPSKRIEWTLVEEGSDDCSTEFITVMADVSIDNIMCK